MIVWRPVAVAADVLGYALPVGVADVASGALVGTYEGYRVQFGRQGSAVESFRRVAILAIVAKVWLAGRLVAVGADERQVQAGCVTGSAVCLGVFAFQRHGMDEIAQVGQLKACWRMAVFAHLAKVGLHRCLVAVGALIARLFQACVTIVAPNLGVFTL